MKKGNNKSKRKEKLIKRIDQQTIQTKFGKFDSIGIP